MKLLIKTQIKWINYNFDKLSNFSNFEKILLWKIVLLPILEVKKTSLYFVVNVSYFLIFRMISFVLLFWVSSEYKFLTVNLPLFQEWLIVDSKLNIHIYCEEWWNLLWARSNEWISNNYFYAFWHLSILSDQQNINNAECRYIPV